MKSFLTFARAADTVNPRQLFRRDTVCRGRRMDNIDNADIILGAAAPEAAAPNIPAVAQALQPADGGSQPALPGANPAASPPQRPRDPQPPPVPPQSADPDAVDL